MHSNTGIWKWLRANRQHQRKSRHRFSHFEDLEKRVLLAVDVGQSFDSAEPQTALQNQEQVSDSNGVTVGDVIHSRIVNGTPTSDYPSVGIVGDQWGGFCSGTLISQRHVLTAAHCAIGVDDSQGTFAVEGQTYSTSEVHVHPEYDDFFLDNDLAIYELDQDVQGIDPSPIFRGTPLVGDLLTLVGYGAGGTGNGGHNDDFGIKRVGTTPIDGVEATIITWVFDNNSESNTAPGDSGGPAFLEVDGILYVAGITSGGDQPDAGIGDHSFDTRVDVFQGWIDAIVEDTNEAGDETGNISGVVWNDHDGDGTFDFDESGLSDWLVYLDLNQDGQPDVNEPTTRTDFNGNYAFVEIPVGTYLVAQVVEEGWEQTSPITSTDTFVGFQRDQNSRIVNGTPTSDYPSVGIVGDQWGGFCSGTLISQRHVLTAAHCAIGVDDSQGTFAVEGQTYSTSEVHVHPEYDDFFLDNDLAIYELDQDVQGIDPSPIFRGTPLVGDLLTLVGYGAGGTGNGGHNDDFGIKRVGTTPIDGVEATIITWVFDNNSESNTAPGDSGGPAFLEVDGILYVAGITSGGDQPDAGIGDHSFDTRVDVFQGWIDAIVEDTNEAGSGGFGENLPGQLVAVATNQTATADFGNRQFDDGIQNGSVIWGTVWNDANGDGLRDTTESGLEGRVVYLDLNGNGTLEEIGVEEVITVASDDVPQLIRDEGQTTGVITVASDDVPQLISDEDLTTVVSELVIDSTAGTIADVNVVFDISHAWVNDLTVELISPAGTRVLLFDQVGLDGDDFSNTTLDDEATQSILDGTAPFAGVYQPQESLSMLAGESVNGIWTLEVVDSWNLDGGFLNSWSLEIEMEGLFAEPSTLVKSELVIDSTVGTIADVNVSLDIAHTWVDDLTVELISPAGTRVLLFDQVGFDGDDFSNTKLDDESSESILDGAAPFAGVYQPQEPLAMLVGEPANGTWTLEILDSWDRDGGFLNSWSLEIATEGLLAEPSTETDENGQYAFKDLQEDTYIVAQVLPVGWKETLPSTGNHTVSVNNAEIGSEVDFGSRLSIGVDEIDALFDEIHSGNHNSSFDFTGDGLVDQQDMDELIENVLGTTYGDTDLDGDVDTVDLTAAIRNFSNTSSTANGWAAGDLDGDGDVDTNDLTRLIGNFTSAKWEW